MVAVEVELHAEGAPSGYPHITQAELLIDEIEVVVQTLPVIGFEEGSVRFLIMPRLCRMDKLPLLILAIISSRG